MSKRKKPSGDDKPKPSRPHVPHYGIPESDEGLLPWSHVSERMAQSRNYWLATAQPNGHPHAVPVWGVWVDETLYVGGGPDTRWARNLAANPKVAVHLDDSDEVVILEGIVEQISEPDSPLVIRVIDAYEQKYEMRQPPPFWVLRPSVVFAWAPFPDTATRWHLGEHA